MGGKTVVITGGNSGIGFETASALAGAGARVVITARDRERGEAAVTELRARQGGDVDLAVFDLGSLASVRAGATEVLERCPRVDVLVNNAGVVLTGRRVTADGYEATFAVNHLGPFFFTQLLTERLVASAPARVVTVSSTAHRSARRGMAFDDLQAERGYSAMPVYGRSKLANILFTTELARRLSGSGVTANSLHPGTVATGYGRDGDATGLLGWGIRVYTPFMKTPDRGARTSVYLASAPAVAGASGEYFIGTRARRPSRAARDSEAARRLWDVSEELVEAAASADGKGGVPWTP